MKKPKYPELRNDPVPFIVADVFHLAALFRRWGDGIADRVGQTQARWQVLSAASEGGHSVPQLARRLGVSRQNVQRIADLLAADGMVRYAWNRNHERSPLVELTPEGRKALATLTRAAAAYHAELADGLDLDDLKAARLVLDKMRIQLERDLTPEQERSDAIDGRIPLLPT